MKQPISVIKSTNLSKTYTSGKVETEVLKSIELDVKEGEFISIMGPSGSGKSTLLYLLGGLESPTSGAISIYNQAIHTLSDKKLSHIRSKTIGFVFQFYNLVPHLTVADNIMLPARLSGCKKNDLINKMNELLDIVGLSDKRNAYPPELSGGQQQRVAIARALIQEPSILLADEPIGNLDSKAGGEIMSLFKRISLEKNLTIIQVTHSLESAAYGNRIVHLLDGQIESTVITNNESAYNEVAYA